MDDSLTVEVPTKVEVSFLVPGAGTTKEIYRLDNADDLLCWSLNERLSKAQQTGIKVLEAVSVPKGRALHIQKSRAGMKRYIDKQISEWRDKIRRGAASGQ